MLKLNFSLKESYLTISTNISLEADKIYAVVGPSGAGKSTFLNLISGFASISSGTIIWNGQEISNLPPAKRSVSILFQDNNLFPHLSVWRNLALAVTHWPKISRDNEEKLKAVMSEVGILGLENRKPSQLSGGQQSRVALARVLLQKNKILLLDEPFSALGPSLKDQMLELIKKIAKNKKLLVLMVTHEPADAKKVASQTLVVKDKKVHPPLTTEKALDPINGPLADYL
ncbi:MAG: ATP-binding cassette domain-containing protein [Paracoccaceae bacterium]|uniref:thiamine ABC transporter ATP-binding protein n=1 Tax=Candidatus Salinivivens marinus TaxID=3381703 RepID=UPI000BDFC9BE|nr:MAG: thiamine ABC transporter ATP-binding protein [Rhodobacteraceae bacterium MED-G08]|tara:strand:- start:771 stop:1457 length:687 start_codon:yes stop_codon:yes gene_type:complete